MKSALIFLNHIIDSSPSPVQLSSSSLQQFWEDCQANFPLRKAYREIWTGKAISNPLAQIQQLIKDDKIREKSPLVKHCKKQGSVLHLILPIGENPYELSIEEIKLLLTKLPQNLEIYLHIGIPDEENITRAQATALLLKIKAFENWLCNFSHITISSCSGNSFAMEESIEKKKVQLYYDELILQQSQTSDSISQYLSKKYEGESFNPEIKPVSFVEGEAIDSDDAILCLYSEYPHHSPLIQLLEKSKHNNPTKKSGNDSFMTKSLRNIFLACLRKPYFDYQETVLIPEEISDKSLCQILSENEIRQLYISQKSDFSFLYESLNQGQPTKYHGIHHLPIDEEIEENEKWKSILESIQINNADFESFIISYPKSTSNRSISAENRKLFLEGLEQLSSSYEIDIKLINLIPHPKKEKKSEYFFPSWHIHPWTQQEIRGDLNNIFTHLLELFNLPHQETAKKA